MKIALALLLSFLSTCALAQAPIARGPGTTNTPSAWTNIVLLTVAPETNTLNTVLRGALAQTNSSVGSVTNAGTAAYSNASAFALSAAPIASTQNLAVVAFNNNGAAVTNIPPGALTSTPPFTNTVIAYGDARQTNAIAIGPGGVVISNASGSVTMAGGTATATLFSGSGASLTSLPAGNLTGSIADARLSANVPLLNTANAFTGNVTDTQNGVSGILSSNAVVVGQIIGNGTAPTITQDGILQVVASGGNALRFWVKLNATNNMVANPANPSHGTNIFTATWASAFPSAPHVLMTTSTNSSKTIYNQGTPEIYANTASSFSLRWWSAAGNSWLTSGTNFTLEFFVVQ